jgi:hypothetical protein
MRVTGGFLRALGGTLRAPLRMARFKTGSCPKSFVMLLR